ncbi:MAG: hypothetical protein ACOVN2_12015, partial [Usitatibacteraceae bacterium]
MPAVLGTELTSETPANTNVAVVVDNAAEDVATARHAPGLPALPASTLAASTTATTFDRSWLEE